MPESKKATCWLVVLLNHEFLRVRDYQVAMCTPGDWRCKMNRVIRGCGVLRGKSAHQSFGHP